MYHRAPYSEHTTPSSLEVRDNGIQLVIECRSNEYRIKSSLGFYTICDKCYSFSIIVDMLIAIMVISVA